MLGLISVDQALEIVLQSPCRLPPEEVDFEHAVGRVLAEDVRSDLDLPPFSRSAVDGFALRAQDLRPVPRRLKVVGMVRAGSFPSLKIEPGQAAQIMTGAPVPDGADAVQMVEHTQRAGEEVEIRQGLSAGQNVAPRASEVKAGELVLRGGTRIDPAAVAVAATVGSTRLRVGRRPRVAVIATGDELVHPSRKPGPGRIRNSNGFALVAQARAAGAQVSYLGVAGDNEESLVGLIGHGLQHRDVLLLSGGVSMGRFDLVESVLEGFEVKLLINAVALKPGKPLVFGLAPKGNLVFGLPGNPVSTMV
ncbi:MAG: gephyrin-like molybdotransferase Glp, partial [Acidobacteriota bacterium]